MRIKLTSILVDDQDKALKFYTDVFGFVKKHDIPATAFEVSNIEQEYQRLRNLGVVFTREPKREGPLTIAICADTCGNLVQLYEPPPPARR